MANWPSTDTTIEPKFHVGSGSAAGIFLTTDTLHDYDEHLIQNTGNNSFTVEASTNGADWVSLIALQNMASTSSTAFVTGVMGSSATPMIVKLKGKLWRIRLNQTGVGTSSALITSY